MYDQELDRDGAVPRYQRLKTVARRHIDQMIRTRKFNARNERIETGGYYESIVKNGRMSAWKGEWGEGYQWKENEQCSGGDTRSLATEVIVGNKHNRRLPVQRPRQRLTQERLRLALVPGEKVLLEGKVRKREKVTSKEIAQIRRVNIGILPCQNYKSKRCANSATNVYSDIRRLTRSKVKSRRKVVGKDQLPC